MFFRLLHFALLFTQVNCFVDLEFSLTTGNEKVQEFTISIDLPYQPTFRVIPEQSVVIESLPVKSFFNITMLRTDVARIPIETVWFLLDYSLNWKTFDLGFLDWLVTIKYRMKCTRNFYGANCLDYCKPRDGDDGHYTCSVDGKKRCRFGWEGQRCTQAVTGCKLSPCLNGGTCSEMQDNFECKCKNGFGGKLCEQQVRPSSSSPRTTTTSYTSTTSTTETSPPKIAKTEKHVIDAQEQYSKEFVIGVTVLISFVVFTLILAVYRHLRNFKLHVVLENCLNRRRERGFSRGESTEVFVVHDKLHRSFSDNYEGRYAVLPNRLSISSCPVGAYEQIFELPKPRSPKPFIYLSQEALNV